MSTPKAAGPKGGKADHKRAGKRDLGHDEGAQSQAARLLRDDGVAGEGEQDADPERRASADREHRAGAGHDGEHRQRPATAQPDRQAGERDAGLEEQHGDVRCPGADESPASPREGPPPGPLMDGDGAPGAKHGGGQPVERGPAALA